jgi:hypothetical protein
MRTFSSVRHLAIAAWLLAPGLAQGARPMLADDASILGTGQCTVESWIDSHPEARQYWMVPHCRAGDWELSGGLGELRPTQASPASNSALLQAKTVFRPLSPNDWGIGIVLADQAGRGTGPAGNLLLNLPLSFSLLNDKLRIHLNAGWVRQRDVRHGLTWAVGGDWAVNQRLGLTLESYGNGPPQLQAGVRYALLSGNLVLDAALGDRPRLNGKARYFQVGMTLNLAVLGR